MSVEYFRQQIHSTEAFIAEANEKLRRLRECRSKLLSQEGTMADDRAQFKEPELSNETWNGKHADQFEQTRESEVVSTYQELIDTTGDAIERTDRQISMTVDVISHQNSLLSNYKIGLENAIEREREKK
ncbi:YwqH-like family protein [Shouchella clausii]|jgi:hypothetical protein|nr:DUF5082 family protein [Shouchella clausii]MBU8595941.1 DUF5082 domain-containing protein [Shouchella clausii]MCY1103128.1 DUF5082 family protein [Shouchella clausii]MED4157550.1 DUF5082 family protein [Shouchella clausii]MED4175615.1 DUF5082 family protein [Shouchella clausii]